MNNMEEFCIVGAGGFGREFLFQATNDSKFISQYSFSGFVDDDDDSLGRVSEEGIFGNLSDLYNIDREINCFICIGNSETRKKIYEKLSKNKNINFPSYINEEIKISKTVKIGQGTILCLGVILTVDITIGEFVIANLDCTIGHDAIIENFSTIYPSVNVSGNVHIGEGTEIGTGTQIIQGKNIGSNTIIGAGSVVVTNIDDKVTAVGVPAKAIKKRK
ncbi:acetyltransferase [Enterococcus hirae]|uniref:acetyltransferase n=2 Tax=Enterococcus hirae TaxID=1354 RepID=UPI0032E43AED